MKDKKKRCRCCHQLKSAKRDFGFDLKTGRDRRRCKTCPKPVKLLGQR